MYNNGVKISVSISHHQILLVLLISKFVKCTTFWVIERKKRNFKFAIVYARSCPTLTVETLQFWNWQFPTSFVCKHKCYLFNFHFLKPPITNFPNLALKRAVLHISNWDYCHSSFISAFAIGFCCWHTMCRIESQQCVNIINNLFMSIIISCHILIL